MRLPLNNVISYWTPPLPHAIMQQAGEENLLEIGDQAVWSLSSCKCGFGVAHLRDGSTETYWQ